MTYYNLVVLTESFPGGQDEYDEWYTNTHLPDVLKLPGVLSGRLFHFVPGTAQPDRSSSTVQKNLAIYEVETDNLDEVFKELDSRMGTGAMAVTEQLDFDKIYGGVFVPITDTVLAARVPAEARE